MKMLSFLKQSRTLLNTTERICIVIGNESCDLDSSVSALTLAYYYQQQQQHQIEQTIHRPAPTNAKWFLPVLNIKRGDYPLKTEVQFAFKQSAIPDESLTFRDELQDELIAHSDVILVDHHVSPLAAQCVEVYDHRPFDVAANLPETCRKHIELVGSCATLIAELILAQANAPKSASVATTHMMDALPLLHNTIVLDTVNFSPAAARATAKDEQMCAAIEQLLGWSASERTSAFEKLCKARADISALTPMQLLHKDLKMLSNRNDSIRIALPGFPLPVEQFIRKPNAIADVQQFAKECRCAVVLLMGLYVSEVDGSVQRDIGLVNISEPKLTEAIRQRLLTSEEPALCLQLYDICDCNLNEAHFYKQKNIRATRKHILPMVKELLLTDADHQNSEQA